MAVCTLRTSEADADRASVCAMEADAATARMACAASGVVAIGEQPSMKNLC